MNFDAPKYGLMDLRYALLDVIDRARKAEALRFPESTVVPK